MTLATTLVPPAAPIPTPPTTAAVAEPIATPPLTVPTAPHSPRDGRHVCLSDRRTIDLVQLRDLLNVTAFWARDRRLEDLATALANSNPVVSAWDGDRLVGLARATSDGIYRAGIWDVVVHPDYQGAGIGRKLVQTVLAHPLLCRVERVYLMTTDQQAFYERIGFEVNTSTTLVLMDHAAIPPLKVLP